MISEQGKLFNETKSFQKNPKLNKAIEMVTRKFGAVIWYSLLFGF